MSLNIGNEGIIIFKQVSYLIPARVFLFVCFNETTTDFFGIYCTQPPTLHFMQFVGLDSLGAWAGTARFYFRSLMVILPLSLYGPTLQEAAGKADVSLNT